MKCKIPTLSFILHIAAELKKNRRYFHKNLSWLLMLGGRIIMFVGYVDRDKSNFDLYPVFYWEKVEFSSLEV